MSASEARNWQQSWQQQTNPTIHTEPERKVKVKINKKRWVTTGEKVLYTVCSAIAVTALFFIVSFSISVDSINRDVQQMEQQMDKQQVQNENLEYKVKELSNPDRILKIAKENGLKIQNAEVKQASTISN
ncbi:cell division protein FtsL [Radiobacillus kanasensis]|uniref:cell division protein FtsL n=1 Tax=Radiobacillus kanasensis TaxID=2844358 RepID=UPI001E361DF5|nr:cell division protein FtsL [Radiobacillus kanasensis]UFU00935.1 cell division protein FtsL [Radiobacillus kanasensis]